MRFSQIAFLIFAGCNIFSQSNFTSIYSLYAVEQQDCTLPTYEYYLNQTPEEEPIYFESTDISFPPPGAAGGESPNQIFEKAKNELPQKFVELSAIYSGPQRKIVLHEKNYLFLENEKWGLKNMEGKELLPPTFEYVFADENGSGFAGYEDVKCKYYDHNGQLLLGQQFYGIILFDSTTFIVHDESGYGVIRNGEMVIPANCKKIEASTNGTIHLKVKDENGVDLLYLSDLKTKLPYPVFDNRFTLHSDRFLEYNREYVDIENAKQLFCEGEFHVSLVDADAGLFLVGKKGKKHGILVDVDGKAVLDSVYTHVSPFGEKGLAIASQEKYSEKLKRSINHYGLINQNYEWVLAPKYGQINWSEDYYVLQGFPFGKGMANSRGEVIAEPKYNTYFKSKYEECFVGFTGQRGAVDISTQIDCETGEIIRDSLPFSRFEDFEICGKNYLLLKSGSWQQLADKNLLPITGVHRYIYKWRENIVAKDYEQIQFDTSSAYNCNGEKLEFQINGQRISRFKKVTAVNENIDHFWLSDGTSYFVDQQGNATVPDYEFNGSEPLGAFGLTVVKARNKMGLIDQLGEYVLPMQFWKITPFDGETGLAAYHNKLGKRGFINQDGEFIFDGKYEQAEHLGLGLFTVKKEGMWAVVNRKDEIILPFHPDKYQLQDGLLMQGTESNAKYFNRLGMEVR